MGYLFFILTRFLVILSKPLAIYGLIYLGLKDLADIYASTIAVFAVCLAFLNCEAHRYFYPKILNNTNDIQDKKLYFSILSSHSLMVFLPIFFIITLSINLGVKIALLQILIVLLDKVADEVLRLNIYKHEFIRWSFLSYFRVIIPASTLLIVQSVDKFFLFWASSLFVGLILQFINQKNIYKSCIQFFQSISAHDYFKKLKDGHYLYIIFAIFSSLVLVYERFFISSIYFEQIAFFSIAFAVAFILEPFIDTIFYTKLRQAWCKSAALTFKSLKYVLLVCSVYLAMVLQSIYFEELYSQYVVDYKNIIKYILPLSFTAIIYVLTYPFTQIAYWHSSSKNITSVEIASLIGILPSLVWISISSNTVGFVWMFLIFFILRALLYLRLYYMITRKLVIKNS